MSDARQKFKAGVDDILLQISEIEESITNFKGDQNQFFQQLAAYTEQLRTLQELGNGLVDAEVPVELLRYVDEGGNPDTFTSELFRRANRANQLSKGKVGALQSLRDALGSEAEAAYPAEADAYDRLPGEEEAVRKPPTAAETYT